MRILTVGAGAVGGYFGAKLLQAHQDTTFLVRPTRAEKLQRNGLVIKDPQNNLITLSSPPTILAEQIKQPFDLILLSCKAYDLEDAICSFAPAVGSNTVILPLLNGMRHIQTLENAFGKDKVLGGLCNIVSTVEADGVIHQMTPTHNITFGELNGVKTNRAEAIAHILKQAKFDSELSSNITLAMWEKWLFLASLAASTCLMRAPIGEIIAAPDGKTFILMLIEEIRSIAVKHGYQPDVERAHRMLTEPGSTLTASMYRDLQHGSRIEAEQIVGDLLFRAEQSGMNMDTLIRLRAAYTHLKAYESQRMANQ
ncbi:2-dehydropantoate 2-reductase [Pragia fontium]|uniref:2-dehydropantoate 2-reductase n=1 Tax=Pragia fontium TaxID=82985 RepID=UPI000E01552A|nr:2-dehydropantoate 2-reductase [Pragia fontium]SUB81345.1 2-dehydropantoate 2-reductase [Pragia fontium]